MIQSLCVCVTNLSELSDPNDQIVKVATCSPVLHMLGWQPGSLEHRGEKSSYCQDADKTLETY